jgi:hypothetical protein
MPLYHFYRLVNTSDDVCYIGMTKRELRKRLHEHKSDATKKNCSSKQMMEKYGRDNVSIVLIHSLECESTMEAHREERRLIEEYRGHCVNIEIPCRTEEEKKAYAKTWYEANKEHALAQQKIYRETSEKDKARRKAYREAHVDEVKARSKAYRETHKDEQKALNKAWYEANKEAISARRREAHAKAKALKSEPTVVEDQ